MHFPSLLLLATLVGSLANPPPPPPPAALKAWVEYAHALHGDAACPPDLPCVHLSRVAFSGKPAVGTLTVKFTGQNVGKRMAEVPVLAPASEVAVVKAHFTAGKGVVHLDDEHRNWVLAAQPGAFTVEAEIRFEPQASLTLELPSPVAAVVDGLEQGMLIFDDTSAQHGGTLFVQSGKRETAVKDDVTMRIDRSIAYGGTTTFVYHYAVAGLREQTRMALPLLGGEAIEAVSPDVPYTVEKGTPTTLAVTLTSAAPTLTVTGHFTGAVTQLNKPDPNPQEYWLFTSDARHPVDVACDGVEIDPSEVPSLPAKPATRAFVLSDNNGLRITPVAVNVDKGRQGSGVAKLAYAQSGTDTWMSDLTLGLQTAPGLDRMVVTSANAAHYAAVGGQPVRMFNAAPQKTDALSLRVSNALLPMRVQWREDVRTNNWLSWASLRLPAQTVHLDEALATVSLRRGFVPLGVWGVESSHGDLLDGLTLYAVLLALLGGALARQARLPWWALVATVILLVGLYTVDAFPHVGILALLAGTVAWVRLPDIAFQRLAERKWAHRLVRLVWALVCFSTVMQALDYAQDRVLSALHPWAQGESDNGEFSVSSAASMLMADGGRAPGTPPAVQPSEEADGVPPPPPSPSLASQAKRRKGAREELPNRNEERLVKKEILQSGRLSLVGGGAADRKPAPPPIRGVREKTVLPVAFAPPGLRATLFNYGFGALPAGQEATAHVLLVGPALRGLWMLADCAALAAVLALLLLRSKRLWFSEVPR